MYLDRLVAAFRKYRDANGARELQVSDGGVSLVTSSASSPLWAFRWVDLEEVVAYKVDAHVVDYICLGFRTSTSERFCVVDEETKGWKELNEALSQRLGVEQSAWLARVALPAFAENWTQLWTRAA